MKFIGSKINSGNIQLNVDNVSIYQDILVVGKHEYLKTDWGYIIFSGELYPEVETQMTFAEQIKECVTNKGVRNVHSLNGKFISIISYSGNTYIIRDHTGTHSPVFYNELLFSNSIDYIQKSGIFETKPDLDSLHLFFQKGYITAPKTPFENLKKLSPFEYLELDKSTVKAHDTFTYEAFTKQAQTNTLSLNDTITHYEKIHKQALKNRMKNKKKVGLLLSGGYDSGGNISAVRDIYDGELSAYSVGFDNKWTELPLAELMAKKFNAKIKSFILDGSEINDLPKIITAFEEPFFENGLFINYKVSSSINPDETDILLGGDGNDQFFGTSGREIALHVLSRKTGFILFQKLFNFISPVLPGLHRYKFHNESILYAFELQHFGFTNSELRKLFLNKDAGQKKSVKKINTRSFKDLYLWRNFNTDYKESALQVINHKAARLTEQANLNISFPYADSNVLSFLNTTTVDQKIKGSLKELISGKGKSKYLFKEYLKEKLPREITHRKKQGGFTPLGIYLDNAELRSKIYKFSTQALGETNLFHKDELVKTFTEIEKSLKNKNEWFWHQQKQQIKLMYLLVIALWWKIYILKDNRQKLSDYLK